MIILYLFYYISFKNIDHIGGKRKFVFATLHFFVTRHNKLECYTTLDRKGLPIKTLYLIVPIHNL